MEYGICEEYGKKSLVLSASDFLGKLKRKGYICIGMSHRLQKELSYMGVA